MLSRLASLSLSSSCGAGRLMAAGIRYCRTVSTGAVVRSKLLSTCSGIGARTLNNNSALFRGRFAGIRLPFLGGGPPLSVARTTSSTNTSNSPAPASDGGDQGDENSSSSSDGGGDSHGESDGPQVTVTASLGNGGGGGRGKYREQYRWKYRRSYTPRDLRNAAQNDEPVYFMLTPPGQPDPGLLNDCYIDTSSLEWLYNPPVLVLSTQLPEHMNLSTVMVLYHPSSQQQQQQKQQQQHQQQAMLHASSVGGNFHAFAHDYYMFTSYVLPAAQLSIASHAVDDYYHVNFKVTPTPAAVYYDYNSQSQRYAFYEVRNGLRNGPSGEEERIYLVPVLLPKGTQNRRVIRGKLLEQGTPVPAEYYTFLAFSVDIHIYIPNLPTI